MTLTTSIENFTIRNATKSDVPLVLSFIKELAAFEKLSHEVFATEEALVNSLFGKCAAAEIIIGDFDKQPVAFALFFPSYSTFLGKPGLYLEDLFVRPKMRGRGFGKVLISYLAHLAQARNCGRLEWSVLAWNEDAMRFYDSLGAKPIAGWVVNRVDGAALEQLAAFFETK